MCGGRTSEQNLRGLYPFRSDARTALSLALLVLWNLSFAPFAVFVVCAGCVFSRRSAFPRGSSYLQSPLSG